MPVVRDQETQGSLVSSGASTPTVPKALRGQYHFEGEHGIPRYQSILSTRTLEKTHTIQIPMDSVLKQVTTMNWNIVPEGENPSELHWDVANHIENWLKSGFNGNNQTFDQFLKAWVRDILSINSGVVELVPTEPDDNGNQWLAEMYVRDGGRFTKVRDTHDRIPNPPEAAYYQHGRPGWGGSERFDRDNPLIDLIKEENWARRYRTNMSPQPFTRDQIVWAEENPMSWDPYGMGRVQSISDVVEILINQDISNTKYFTGNDVPEGLLQLVDAEQDKVKRFREDWKENIASEQHKMAIVGGDVDWTRFRASPEELQFLESQQWYHKLVWMAFGVSPNEVGETGDLNLATAKEQSATIFRKTTKPLLKLVQNELNGEILPKLRAWNLINGEVRFEWDLHNEAVEQEERQKQESDLSNNLVTINEVRQERGQEEVFWGDMPVETYKQMARNHPEWLAEQLGYEDVPDPVGGGGLFSSMDDDDPDGGNTSADHPDAINSVDPGFPIRDEPRPDSENFPDHDEEFTALKRTVSTAFQNAADDAVDIIQDQWPNTQGLADQLQLADALEGPMIEQNIAAMERSADVEVDRLEDEVEQHLDVHPDDIQAIDIDFDVKDTFAARVMEQRVRADAASIEGTVGQMLERAADGADSVDEATEFLQEKGDQISDGHAETAARTQILSASREGNQALAESSDLIGGKEWNATNDGRTRAWHAEMDGVTVEKDEEFVVPATEDAPSEYPKRTFVVGNDQPYNCRCHQQSVLAEDMPTDVTEANAIDGIRVEIRLSDRQYEVWQEHHEEGESFVEMWGRLRDEMSAQEMGEEVVSTSTIYKWDDVVEDFAP